MENSNNHYCLSITPSSLELLSIIGFITLILIRVLYIIHRSSQPRSASSQQKPLSTLIVLGSGGHTAEMINLLNVLQKNSFTPRYYIAAATDNMSLQKAQVLENSWLNEGGVEEVGSAKFMQIYRSREVGQSYITSVGTTLIALAHALWLMIKIRPHVVFHIPYTRHSLYKLLILGIRWSYIFYVESIARVRRLSLSALLLYKLRMADQLFVQWPQLKSKYHRAHYVGRLM
ncbi:UDP-N-acetylglucosamine transferase subunit ALG14-like isoform X2 [Coffea arabica]|uniref:UDP-N-acetylglucosamine transferase subunit ALG14 n=1 Tax=Coffea arabica TaxID=13443 RepID=A0ABM4UWB9_COFAR